MKHLTIEARVSGLKKKFERYTASEESQLTLEPVDTEIIKKFRALEYFPSDMLMILDQFGCMRSWGHNGCARINWWIPSTIELVMLEDRCSHELLDSNFTNPSSLLFFASDCDAKCYFYDTTATPWKVVACDGLDVSIYNQRKDKTSPPIDDWDGKVALWEEDEPSDALSIIESWAFD